MSDVSFPGPGQHDGRAAAARRSGAGRGGPGTPVTGGGSTRRWPGSWPASRPAGSGSPGRGQSPACTVSLGEACNVDLGELAAMTGPDGLAGETFAQGRAADAMRPGPVLSALTERAAEESRRLTDNALLGLVSAARRAQARAEYLELAAVAEFTRRRAAQLEGQGAEVPRGCRGGEHADQELGVRAGHHRPCGRRPDGPGRAPGQPPPGHPRRDGGRNDRGPGAGDLVLHEVLVRCARGGGGQDPGRRRARAAGRPAGAAGGAVEMKLDPRRCGAQGTGPQGGPPGGGPPGGVRELLPGRAGAGHRGCDGLDGVHQRRGRRAEPGGHGRVLAGLRALVFTDHTQGLDPLGPANRPPAGDEAGEARATREDRKRGRPTGWRRAAGMRTPAGTAAPTCPNGSMRAAGPTRRRTRRARHPGRAAPLSPP